ncbi:MAG: rhodanese-like domain-containing protein [Flammeovirgaceae bacterium]|nr:rhodanese-like domain-containing protein [Flammeovirgaceae bacterium]MDW8288040.1 rhodanese-like domain-containing protein [Flammeovirgaceae bacterium]
MFSFFKKLFSTPDLQKLLQEGAAIVDVRTPQEFKSGHAKGAMNIPLDAIASNADSLKKYSHIIVCCASGMRSGQAKSILEKKGFTNVTNGGSWYNVAKIVGQE